MLIAPIIVSKPGHGSWLSHSSISYFTSSSPQKPLTHLEMATESPESGLGSGSKLAAELCRKADLGDSHADRPLSKRDDLRVAALENYASQKIQQ